MAISHKKKIAHIKKSDPILALAIANITIRPIPRRENYFEALVEAIVSQQLSVKASDTIFTRFAALTPGKQFPTPHQVLKIPASKMRKAGLSKMKVSFIKDLAKHVIDKSVNLKEVNGWSDEKVIEHLTAVRGIGPWTAEMFLIFSLGREDVFSVGDLGLKNAIRTIYKLKKHPTPSQIKKITEKWSPYRSVASRYLWATLNNTPVK
jgi:DNA-3-methyladenine glycosylase II